MTLHQGRDYFKCWYVCLGCGDSEVFCPMRGGMVPKETRGGPWHFTSKPGPTECPNCGHLYVRLTGAAWWI